MKKLVFIVIIASMCIGGGVIRADLGDFKKNVDREQNENRKKNNKNGGKKTGSGGCLDGCVSDFIGYTILFWVWHNVSVYYLKYPYENDRTNNLVKVDHEMSGLSADKQENIKPGKQEKELVYINGKWVEINKNTKNTTLTTDDKITGRNKQLPEQSKKNYFYTLEAGGHKTDDTGTGAFFGLRGRFWKIIGPECEVKRLWDGDEFLDYYAFGVNIPLLQFSGFMPDFYIQRSMFRGAVHLTGWSYGFSVQSYPVKPLSFTFRYGWRHYQYIQFKDMEARVGTLINRVEFFAGYRYLKAAYTNIRGPQVGIKIWI